jgi:hypothetical protein
MFTTSTISSLIALRLRPHERCEKRRHSTLINESVATRVSLQTGCEEAHADGPNIEKRQSEK